MDCTYNWIVLILESVVSLAGVVQITRIWKLLNLLINFLHSRDFEKSKVSGSLMEKVAVGGFTVPGWDASELPQHVIHACIFFFNGRLVCSFATLSFLWFPAQSNPTSDTMLRWVLKQTVKTTLGLVWRFFTLTMLAVIFLCVTHRYTTAS